MCLPHDLELSVLSLYYPLCSPVKGYYPHQIADTISTAPSRERERERALGETGIGRKESDRERRSSREQGSDRDKERE